MVCEQRCRGDRGRHRDGDALAEPIAHGAGQRAARLPGAARRPELFGDPPQPCRQRAAGHEDARDRDERQLPAQVPAGSRVQSKRDGGRQEQRVPARRGPRERHRRDAGGAHHAGALQRWPGARQRHIQRHQTQQRKTPPTWPQPGGHEYRQRERHQQHHVLPAHREQVRQAGVAPVVARCAVDLLVLAEHHPEGQRGVRLRQSGGNCPLSTAPQAVQHTGDAAAPRAGEPDALDEQLTRDAAPAQVGSEVEARIGIVRRPAQTAGEQELVADRGAAGKGAPSAASEAQQDARAGERAAGDAGLGRGSEGRGPGTREEVGANRDRPRVPDRGGCVVERVEPGGADRAPRQEQGGGHHREPGRAGASQAGEQDGRGGEGERGHCLGQRESGSERACRHVPRPTGQVAHSCRASRSVASLFSPMPST